MNGAGIILAQAHELLARHIGAGVHEERGLAGGLAAALEGEVAELENVGLDHELDELLLVSLHEASFHAGASTALTHLSDRLKGSRKAPLAANEQGAQNDEAFPPRRRFCAPPSICMGETESPHVLLADLTLP